MDNNNLTIQIFDEIGGWGFTLHELNRQVSGFSGNNVTIPLNSYGGQVFEGLAIYNGIKGLKQNTQCNIVGIAASMGTIVALASDKVTMPANSYFMIHEPSMFTGGDAEDMDSASKLLESTANQLASIYSQKTGLSVDELRILMKKETWLTANEALEMGFIDEVTDTVDIQAKIDLSIYNNVPSNLKDKKLKSKKMDFKKIISSLKSKLGIEVKEGSTPEETVQNIQNSIEQAPSIKDQIENAVKAQSDDFKKQIEALTPSGDEKEDMLKVKKQLIAFNKKFDEMSAKIDNANQKSDKLETENKKLKNVIDEAAFATQDDINSALDERFKNESSSSVVGPSGYVQVKRTTKEKK